MNDYDGPFYDLMAAYDYKVEAYGDRCPGCGLLRWGGDCPKCYREDDDGSPYRKAVSEDEVPF